MIGDTTRLRRLEVATNISILVAMTFLSTVIGLRYFRPSDPVRPSVQVGDRLSLDGVNWAANKNTLLMVLDKDCRYCQASTPFYKKLVREAAGAVALVAVMPHDLETSREYLRNSGIQVESVVRADLVDLKIPGTPALLLVDERGVVKKFWRGMLQSEKEETDVVSSIPRVRTAT